MHDPATMIPEHPASLWEMDPEAEDGTPSGAIAQAKRGPRDPPAQVVSKQQIAADLRAMGTTVEAWFADIDTHATFLGQPIAASTGSVPGVHPLLVRRLALVEQRLMAELGADSTAACGRQLGVKQVSGLRRPKPATGGTRVSMHSFGLAIDVNYQGNPFLQAGSPACGVIERATQLVRGTPVNVMAHPFPGDAGKTWDRLHQASEDLKVYFQLARTENLARLRSLAARTAGSGHDATWWQQQIAADHRRLDHQGSFVGRDPAKGFLDLDRRLVVALVETGGLLWGGMYPPRAGKDLMHFDWRGPGKDRMDPKSWLQVGATPARRGSAASTPQVAASPTRQSPQPPSTPRPPPARPAAPEPDTTIRGQTLFATIPLGRDCVGTRDAAGNYQCGGQFTLPARTGIFFPERYQDTKSLDVIVYLHGFLICGGRATDQIDRYWRNRRFLLREGLNRTGRSFVLVVPSLGPKGQSGVLHQGGFDTYMTQVLAAINQQRAASGATPRDIGRIILAGHSAGGSTMRAIATGGGTYARRIRECWGFDCLYGGGDPEAWERWAKANPDARLYIHYTVKKGGTQAGSKRLRAKGLANVVIPEAPQHDEHCDVPGTYWERRIVAALQTP